MKKYLLFLFAVLTSIQFAQPIIIPNSESSLNLEENLRRKIVSNKLLTDIKQSLIRTKNRSNENAVVEEEKIGVVIYFSNYPTDSEISQLEDLGLTCYIDTWIPPLSNHPLGFILAKLPPAKLKLALAKPFIKKLDSSTHKSYPNNNLGTASIGANDTWMQGLDGSGIKVAILDSGLDSFYEGTDLPIGYERLDCWDYPTTDANVENLTSGHGTHVTGSVLGRGTLSAGNTGNGGGSYKGSAPGADLVFLKIGGDQSSGASSAAMIGAMQEAINTFNADVLSMSYGGWYDHHDGSSSVEQTVDWVYNQGVPFFISAGNSANDNRHYYGTVTANSTTGLIQVNASGVPVTGNYYLYFNLVWVDGILGIGSTDLEIQLYDNSMTPIATLSDGGQNESTRGTESEYFYYNNSLITDGIYYISVTNNSGTDQEYHIYEAWNGGKVTFQNPNLFYTIGQPASADHGFAVGAYTSRSSWTDYAGNGWGFGYTQDDITPFSSLGPRIDGMNKPEITAPGSEILSLRDTDVLTSDNAFTIDNDGSLGVGAKNYYGMGGTSMATPLAAGAAALYLQYFPRASPQEIYDALQNNATTDGFTGVVPNSIFGHGKLNIYKAIFNSQLMVDIKVLLEGAYDVSASEMTTTLNTPGSIVLPFAQPFNTAPWLYAGTEIVASIPADVTDWVLVELRSDLTTVEVSKPAFIKKDGTIIDLNGFPFKITGNTGDYHIVVNHRNHLSVMSNLTTISNTAPPPTNVASVEMKFSEKFKKIQIIDNNNIGNIGIKR